MSRSGMEPHALGGFGGGIGPARILRNPAGSFGIRGIGPARILRNPAGSFGILRIEGVSETVAPVGRRDRYGQIANAHSRRPPWALRRTFTFRTPLQAFRRGVS